MLANTKGRLKAGVFKGKGGQWHFRIRARNGRIVCDGAEGYARRAGARGALLRLVGQIQDGNFLIDETGAK